LYRGSLFTLALKAARALVPDEWIRVLSAKHGYVRLDQVIEPYDTTWGAEDAITKPTWPCRRSSFPSTACWWR